MFLRGRKSQAKDKFEHFASLSAQSALQSFSGALRPSYVNLRTLINIRWIAIAGQGITIILVKSLGYSFDAALCIILVCLSALVNIGLMMTRRVRLGLPNAWMEHHSSFSILCFDLFQLAALLWLTGGLHNPFSLLLLVPVCVAAITLMRSYTALITAIAMILSMGLLFTPYSLPYITTPYLAPDHILIAMSIALQVSFVFMSFYLANVSHQNQKMSNAISNLHLSMERERKLVALGGLAAAAAHELGTPLSTIAVVAKEMSRDLPEDSDLYADAILLQEESDRCREILAQISRTNQLDDSLSYNLIPIQALIELAAARYLDDNTSSLKVIAAPFDKQASALQEQPQMLRRPELIQGLGNLLQNALQHAKSEVTVYCQWDEKRLEITIHDDGLGFELGIISRLGEPYTQGDKRRKQASKHKASSMGVGLFIASTLLTGTGAKIRLGNHQQGGALVTVSWQRDDLSKELGKRTIGYEF